MLDPNFWERLLENPNDIVDKDTNNDSEYSTNVYRSCKGNSPSLSAQIEEEGIGASSLVYVVFSINFFQ